MPDDTSTALTAKPIPGALTITGQSGPMNIAPRNMAEAIEFARVMSKAGVLLREPFRDNPGLCLGVSLQAWRSNADPFALASKAFVVNNQIAYESQAIHALVNTSPVIARRLRATYSGEGDKRRCKVIGWIRGEEEPFEYESPEIGKIPVKNSPLWKSDPDQQLFYSATRAWARRWVPEVLLGIYTTDEIDGQIIDVTADRMDAHAAALQPAPVKTFVWQPVDHSGEVYDFKTPENACDACRRILITAAAINPDALATAWENNGEFIATLREAEYGSDADALERLHRELAPQESPVPDQPQQKGETTLADGSGPLNHSDPMTGDTESHPAAAGPTLTTEPAPQPQNDQRAETPAAERGGMPPPRDEHSASPPAAATQTAERHDPFWDRESLAVAVPDDRRGKPDWRGWTALLLPRIRQAWAVPLLNALYEDNRDTLRSYASNIGQRPADEIEAEFDAARMRLAP